MAGLGLLQIIPIPLGVIRIVSPAQSTVASALDLSYNARIADGALAWSPLSVDPIATVWALMVFGAALLVFLACRQLFHVGGVGLTVRTVVWLGLFVTLLGIAQEATSRNLVYWWWQPFDEGAEPFGPFINRNHFGTWATMVTPLCLGFAFARLHLTDDEPGRRRIGAVFRVAVDDQVVLAALVGCLLTVGMVMTLSRSALAGLGVAFLVLLLGGGPRLDRRRRRWLTACAILSALAIVLLANVPAVFQQVDQTLTSSSGRLVIWAESLPIVRDFWLTGTGAGSFETAMLVYQQSDRGVYFNHAHNHYLQLLVEGGLLLAAPVALAVAAWARLAARRLTADRSPTLWFRLGALAGLSGVAVQSVWETGLRMPANAAVAAVLAALVVYPPREEAPSPARVNERTDVATTRV